jgi:AraC-like DNA-binding protein
MHEHGRTAGAVAGFTPRKLRPFAELAAQRGLDVDRLLAVHGASRALLEDPEARLSRVTCIAIMKELFVALCDPHVGLHAARYFVLADMDLLGFLAEQHATVLSAIEAIVGYAGLIGDASRAQLVAARGRVTLEQWVVGAPPQLPELADYQIASSHRGVCILAGCEVTPCAVELARPRPTGADEYRSFFGAPVVFGAERGRLVYAETDLRRPRASGNPRLAQLLSEQIEQRRLRIQPGLDMRERARRTLRAQLDQGATSLNALARDLWMSERTLRRRLEAIGCSYRELVDEVRRERLFELLDSGEAHALGVGGLAHRLGFDDPTAFARAFRRWTGTAPSSYLRGGNSAAPHAPAMTAYKPPSNDG